MTCWKDVEVNTCGGHLLHDETARKMADYAEYVCLQCGGSFRFWPDWYGSAISGAPGAPKIYTGVPDRVQWDGVGKLACP